MLSLILVGVVGLLGPTAATAAPESVEPSKPQDASKASASASAASATRLNPNLARAEDLAALPHVTSELAKSMIDARPFLGMKPLDDFLEGKLTREQRDELYRTMWVPIDLDEATEAEILFIPGVGKRMAHEFEEYRPYDGMARFRREIGKYVDEAEVTRLAGFVFLPIDLNTATREEILAIPGVGKRMAHEFEEYRPYDRIERFRREIGKYVDEKEVRRLERYVEIR